jgi:hypothetical protein
MVLAELEAIRAEVAEVDTMMRGVDAPDGAREVAERRVARRSGHVQAVK